MASKKKKEIKYVDSRKIISQQYGAKGIRTSTKIEYWKKGSGKTDTSH